MTIDEILRIFIDPHDYNADECFEAMREAADVLHAADEYRVIRRRAKTEPLDNEVTATRAMLFELLEKE